ncbi:MAG: methyltransferase domain-containing protein [Gluconacetobacter diazotrophicus]|nr:methyltransferase domain-containing protein [Gluconacetobacter diazotrophicus]
MPRPSGRILLPELMDTEPCSPAEFAACLRDLATVNRLFGAYRPTLRFLRAARPILPADRPWRILDVGGGSGDMLRRIDRWAARRFIPLDLASLDLSPWAAPAGQAAPPTRTPIRFITADVFDFDPPEPPDLVISSLFAHHLDDEGVIRFLRWMERHAATGWFVNDLLRHPLSFHGFRLVAAAMRWHRFVRHDGPVSINRAFRPAEWRALLAAAGIPAAIIRHRVPFRLCVSRLRTERS